MNDALMHLVQRLDTGFPGMAQAAVRVPHDMTVQALLARPDAAACLGHGVVLVDAEGRRLGFLSPEDLTECLRQAFDRLAQVEADAQAGLDRARAGRNALIASLGHELRTPINAIVGYAELTCTTMADAGSTRCRDYVETIWEASQSLLGTIDSILDMSRLQAGVVELRESEVALPSLIEAIRRLLASGAAMRRVTLQADIADDLPRVWADARMLRQILINLVGNAIKYGHADSLVQINARCDKAGRMIIDVRDRGPGIPPEKLALVMQPFRQLDAEGERGMGAGLGLPLVKALVEMHEGSFRLLSTPGKGTRALVILPAGRVMGHADQAGQGAFAFRRLPGDIYS